MTVGRHLFYLLLGTRSCKEQKDFQIRRLFPARCSDRLQNNSEARMAHHVLKTPYLIFSFTFVVFVAVRLLNVPHVSIYRESTFYFENTTRLFISSRAMDL